MPSLNRITFISNYNAYESKRHFSAKLAEAMERKGIEVQRLDAGEKPLMMETINAIVAFNPTITCSFNTLSPLKPGVFLSDYLQIPHLSMLVDPAIYSMEQLQTPYALLSCVDREDYHLLSQETPHSFFFPHAVEKELLHSGCDEKIYDVVFIGSCYDYRAVQAHWQKALPEVFNDLLLEASRKVLTSPSTSITMALFQTLQEFKIDFRDLDLRTLFYYVDRYSRGKDRVELIQAIKEAKVHIFGAPAEGEAIEGADWRDYFVGYNNITIHPALPFTKSFDVLKRSKIVLNSAPFFKQGSHERIFTALACGALPMTNETPYWSEEFNNNENIALYTPGDWDSVNSTINELLNNEAKRREMAALGSLKVQNEHTWDQRVETLLQVIPDMLMEM